MCFMCELVERNRSVLMAISSANRPKASSKGFENASDVPLLARMYVIVVKRAGRSQRRVCESG